MQKLVFSLLLGPIFIINGMQKKKISYNKRVGGCTALHYAAMLRAKDLNKNIEELDMKKAQTAAFLIMTENQIDMINSAAKTPLDYAQENKELLPHVYTVMVAGKVKLDFESKIPLKEIYSFTEMERIHALNDEYQKALNTLFKYLSETLQAKPFLS